MKNESRIGNDRGGGRSFEAGEVPASRKLRPIDADGKPVSSEADSVRTPAGPVSLETDSVRTPAGPVSFRSGLDQPHNIVQRFLQASDHGASTAASERLADARVIADRLRLLDQEIQHDGDTAAPHFARLLPLAKRALDAAHAAITREAGRQRTPVSEAQVRETIRALGSEETWLELLEAHEMGSSEMARQAVRRIARAIKSLDGDVSPDFDKLLADIDFLRTEITRALRTTGKLSEFTFFRELLRAAKEVSAEVATAMLIVAAQDQTRPWSPDVVHAGLGTAVGYTVRTLYAALLNKLRDPTPAAMFMRLHRQLIVSVRNLTFYLPYIARPEPLPKLQDVIEGARLRATLLLANVDQLAIEIPFTGRDRYRAILDQVRGPLERMREVISRLRAAGDAGLARDVADMADGLLSTAAELEPFSEVIKRLLRT